MYSLNPIKIVCSLVFFFREKLPFPSFKFCTNFNFVRFGSISSFIFKMIFNFFFLGVCLNWGLRKRRKGEGGGIWDLFSFFGKLIIREKKNEGLIPFSSLFHKFQIPQIQILWMRNYFLKQMKEQKEINFPSSFLPIIQTSPLFE